MLIKTHFITIFCVMLSCDSRKDEIKIDVHYVKATILSCETNLRQSGGIMANHVLYANVFFFRKQTQRPSLVYGHLMIQICCGCWCFIYRVRLFCEIWLFMYQILLTIPYNSIWLGKISSNCTQFCKISPDANCKELWAKI